MSIIPFEFKNDFHWNPTEYGPGTGLRSDTHVLTDQPAGARFVSAQLEIEEAVGAHWYLAYTPPEGSLGPSFNFMLHYGFDFPIGRLKYTIRGTLAVPSDSAGKDFVPRPASGRVVLFEHENFFGRHLVIDDVAVDLSHIEDGFWNDRISSFAVLRGNWKFFRHAGFQHAYDGSALPKLYPRMSSQYPQFENDSVSSLLCVH